MASSECVDKSLRILERLGDAGSDGLALTRIAECLRLPKASVHRALVALRRRGFVQKNEFGKYCLGVTYLEIADSYLRGRHLCGPLHEGLSNLCARIDETCHLGVLTGDQVVYVDKVEPKHAVRTWSDIGWRNPALATALGRAISSQKFLDYESFACRFPGPVPRRTPHSLGSLQEIWREVNIASQRGFAMEEQENEIGMSCIAVAVLRGHTPIAAISITAPSARLNQRRVFWLIQNLHEVFEKKSPPGLHLQKLPRSTSVCFSYKSDIQLELGSDWTKSTRAAS
jgi:IclR family acetate operon transcriptional repressor